MSKHRPPRPNHFHFEQGSTQQQIEGTGIKLTVARYPLTNVPYGLHLWLLAGRRYLSLEIGL